ncbi:cyclase family protein [Roseomonas sp. CCTCC AB2023176]|uniref:cyclase family protein n=1 Tax=Roseomonas sp. CCTCC AB2023176 TaxID=3342640 RepID=UPI0035E0A86C
MCDACVMKSVATSLGRRGMFAAAAAAASVFALSARPAVAQAVRSAPVSRVVDLTHTLRPDFPTFGGDPAFQQERILTFAKDGYNLNRFTYGEHVGTHFDAPIHFSENGATVDRIPVESLVCPLVVLDVRERAAANADYQATAEDLAAWESRHGRVPPGACVALNSGWDGRAGGAGFRNVDAGNAMRFPGFRPDIIPALAERGVAAVAVDTLSLDHGGSTTFDFHKTWLGGGRWGIECVAGLGNVPPVGATLVAGAPKIAGGTGGHGRVIALV